MARAKTGTLYKKPLKIPVTGASDDIEVAEYIFYAADGYSATPGDYSFDDAYEIGRLTGLRGLPCKAQTGHGDEGVGDDEEVIRDHYHPEHIYFFRFYEWEIGKRYAIWIRAVDTAGNIETLNESGANSIGEPLSLTDIMQDPDVNVSEFTAVTGLVAANVTNNEGSAAGEPLGGQQITMEWDPLTQLPVGDFPRVTHDAEGNVGLITFQHSRDITRYGIWMFVSNGNGEPVEKYPGTASQATGDWYHVGYTTSNSFQYSCPPGAKVAFWVGFETENTSSALTAPPFKDS